MRTKKIQPNKNTGLGNDADHEDDIERSIEIYADIIVNVFFKELSKIKEDASTGNEQQEVKSKE